MSPHLADGFTEMGKRKKGQYIEKLHAEIAGGKTEEQKEVLVQNDDESIEKWIEFINAAYTSLEAKYNAQWPQLFQVDA